MTPELKGGEWVTEFGEGRREDFEIFTLAAFDLTVHARAEANDERIVGDARSELSRRARERTEVIFAAFILRRIVLSERLQTALFADIEGVWADVFALATVVESCMDDLVDRRTYGQYYWPLRDRLPQSFSRYLADRFGLSWLQGPIVFEAEVVDLGSAKAKKGRWRISLTTIAAIVAILANSRGAVENIPWIRDEVLPIIWQAAVDYLEALNSASPHWVEITTDREGPTREEFVRLVMAKRDEEEWRRIIRRHG